MKELSIAGKATRYDEALKEAVIAHKDEDRHLKATLERIFPELKESEDERMIQYFKDLAPFDKADELYEKYGFSHKDAIAWLEKQCNHINSIYDKELSELLHIVICRYVNDPDISYIERENVSKKIFPYVERLEKQGEHANFLSKIQIGDKVTRNEDGVLVNLSQLNRVAKKDEKQSKNDMGISEATKKKLEDNLHKALEKETPESFNKFLDEQGEQKPADNAEPKFHKGDWVVYCNDDVDLITGIEENGYCINNGGYIPFICENEMRLWDITDAKVGDVLVSESTCGLGTWYCIFKSLDGDESMTVYCYLAMDGRFETKKEQCFDKDPYNTKPATKEQRGTLMKAMADAGYTFDFEKKELKKIEQPSVCGEKDEVVLDALIRRLEGEDVYVSPHLAAERLKSLKERYTWKPSDEQMEYLSAAIEESNENPVLESLLSDLKRLR